MFAFTARVIAFFALAVAVVSAVLDLTRSIASSSFAITPLGASWATVSPETMQLSQTAVERYVHPLLWDPLISWFLLLPTWGVFGILAVGLFWFGKTRENPLGRFASE